MLYLKTTEYAPGVSSKDIEVQSVKDDNADRVIYNYVQSIANRVRQEYKEEGTLEYIKNDHTHIEVFDDPECNHLVVEYTLKNIDAWKLLESELKTNGCLG